MNDYNKIVFGSGTKLIILPSKSDYLCPDVYLKCWDDWVLSI